jgi:hypothetical protein
VEVEEVVDVVAAADMAAVEILMEVVAADMVAVEADQMAVIEGVVVEEDTAEVEVVAAVAATEVGVVVTIMAEMVVREKDGIKNPKQKLRTLETLEPIQPTSSQVLSYSYYIKLTRYSIILHLLFVPVEFLQTTQ